MPEKVGLKDNLSLEMCTLSSLLDLMWQRSFLHFLKSDQVLHIGCTYLITAQGHLFLYVYQFACAKVDNWQIHIAILDL